MVTCWEKADILALLCAMYYCVFVTFPCGVLGQVWCLIVSIPDFCILSYFYDSILLIDLIITPVVTYPCHNKHCHKHSFQLLHIL